MGTHYYLQFVVHFQKWCHSFGFTNKLWAILARVVQGEQKLQLETIVINWQYSFKSYG